MFQLAICIPTFNRAAELDDLLASICQQYNHQQMQGRVQVCISDNASTDGTSQCLSRWSANSRLDITYFRQPSNRGPDLNFLKAVELADAKFCWLMGSDDALAEHALERMLAIVDKIDQRVSVILTDYIACSRILEPIRVKGWGCFPEAELYVDFNNKHQVKNYLSAARSLGALFAYLSTVIIRKTSWDRIKDDPQFVGTVYMHAYKTLSMLLQGGHLLYIRQPMVLNRGGNDSFYHNAKQRVLMDLRGYLLLANNIIPAEMRPLFLQVLRYWVPFRLIKRLILYEVNEKYDDNFFTILKQMGYPPFSLRVLKIINRYRHIVRCLDQVLKSIRLRNLRK